MALPAVLRMYRQSRINNFQNEVRGVYKSAQQQFVSDSMSLNTRQKILYTNATNCEPEGVDLVKWLDMTGNTDFKYYVLMNVDGKVLNVRATNGTYSYSIKTASAKNDLKIENIDVEINNQSMLDSNIEVTLCPNEEDSYIHIATVVDSDNCDKTTPTYELIIAGGNFYVVSSNSSETVLLAKFALNESNNQDNNANIQRIMFLDDNNISYWDNFKKHWDGNNWTNTNNSGGLLSPYNDGAHYCSSANEINCAYVYDSNVARIYNPVNIYANKISLAAGTNVSGRLMSLEEAYNMSSESRKFRNSGEYWLGSAHGDSRYVWVVNTAGNIYDRLINNNYAIRPVIIVNTSDL